MAVRSPHKTKQAAKQALEYSEGVGGPGGMIVPGRKFLYAGGNQGKKSTVILKGGKRAILPSRLQPKKINPNAHSQKKPMLSGKVDKTKAEFEDDLRFDLIDMSPLKRLDKKK